MTEGHQAPLPEETPSSPERKEGMREILSKLRKEIAARFEKPTIRDVVECCISFPPFTKAGEYDSSALLNELLRYIDSGASYASIREYILGEFYNTLSLDVEIEKTSWSGESSQDFVDFLLSYIYEGEPFDTVPDSKVPHSDGAGNTAAEAERNNIEASEGLPRSFDEVLRVLRVPVSSGEHARQQINAVNRVYAEWSAVLNAAAETEELSGELNTLLSEADIYILYGRYGEAIDPLCKAFNLQLRNERAVSKKSKIKSNVLQIILGYGVDNLSGGEMNRLRALWETDSGKIATSDSPRVAGEQRPDVERDDTEVNEEEERISPASPSGPPAAREDGSGGEVPPPAYVEQKRGDLDSLETEGEHSAGDAESDAQRKPNTEEVEYDDEWEKRYDKELQDNLRKEWEEGKQETTEQSSPEQHLSPRSGRWELPKARLSEGRKSIRTVAEAVSPYEEGEHPFTQQIISMGETALAENTSVYDVFALFLERYKQEHLMRGELVDIAKVLREHRRSAGAGPSTQQEQQNAEEIERLAELSPEATRREGLTEERLRNMQEEWRIMEILGTMLPIEVVDELRWFMCFSEDCNKEGTISRVFAVLGERFGYSEAFIDVLKEMLHQDPNRDTFAKRNYMENVFAAFEAAQAGNSRELSLLNGVRRAYFEYVDTEQWEQGGGGTRAREAIDAYFTGSFSRLLTDNPAKITFKAIAGAFDSKKMQHGALPVEIQENRAILAQYQELLSIFDEATDAALEKDASLPLVPILPADISAMRARYGEQFLELLVVAARNRCNKAAPKEKKPTHRVLPVAVPENTARDWFVAYLQQVEHVAQGAAGTEPAYGFTGRDQELVGLVTDDLMVFQEGSYHKGLAHGFSAELRECVAERDGAAVTKTGIAELFALANDAHERIAQEIPTGSSALEEDISEENAVEARAALRVAAETVRQLYGGDVSTYFEIAGEAEILRAQFAAEKVEELALDGLLVRLLRVSYVEGVHPHVREEIALGVSTAQQWLATCGHNSSDPFLGGAEIAMLCSFFPEEYGIREMVHKNQIHRKDPAKRAGETIHPRTRGATNMPVALLGLPESEWVPEIRYAYTEAMHDVEQKAQEYLAAISAYEVCLDNGGLLQKLAFSRCADELAASQAAHHAYVETLEERDVPFMGIENEIAVHAAEETPEDKALMQMRRMYEELQTKDREMQKNMLGPIFNEEQGQEFTPEQFRRLRKHIAAGAFAEGPATEDVLEEEGEEDGGGEEGHRRGQYDLLHKRLNAAIKILLSGGVVAGALLIDEELNPDDSIMDRFWDDFLSSESNPEHTAAAALATAGVRHNADGDIVVPTTSSIERDAAAGNALEAVENATEATEEVARQEKTAAPQYTTGLENLESMPEATIFEKMETVEDAFREINVIANATGAYISNAGEVVVVFQTQQGVQKKRMYPMEAFSTLEFISDNVQLSFDDIREYSKTKGRNVDNFLNVEHMRNFRRSLEDVRKAQGATADSSPLLLPEKSVLSDALDKNLSEAEKAGFILETMIQQKANNASVELQLKMIFFIALENNLLSAMESVIQQ